MIRANIKSLEGKHLDHGDFANEALAHEWFQPFIDKGVYGQKHVPSVSIPESVDPITNEVIPAYVTKEIAAAFTIEFEDVSNELEQSRINAEALKLLADSDWLIVRELETGTPCPQEVKTARAEARVKIVHG